MDFGKAIGVACSTFAVTNIDDLFVLATFFAEAATNKAMTPLRITLGQYLGFTIIIAFSMIGFAVALAVDLFISLGEEESENMKIAGMKSVLKVSLMTLINGGDNTGVYVPLFAQAKKAEIAMYVLVYYIMLGIWCLVA
ncbi:hypothetical protein KVT40_008506 [Elsinoe batatas]|uniref:Cadmium resistance transporter n=1 Tax=Elsinoe batatas TaxID=2601811 RepID=A0A8K0KX52_9PEZI|nr:hypothetical protein KVT40_008506 [Elsinoe batatas]